MTNLILSGGSGTRLWPLSRNSLPKQFLPLFGRQTLFQKTVLRNRELAKTLVVATGTLHEPLVRRQIEELDLQDYRIQTEPVGRNTAPAIALGCLALPRDELVLVTPSDHLIGNEAEYKRAIQRGQDLAKSGVLVTFGIEPTYPETGYGYIERSGESVLSFREKPDLLTAKKYLETGGYVWNSGMFLFQAGTFLDELAEWAPDVLERCRAAGPVPTAEAMANVPAVSVDYAVMEKSRRVRVVPLSADWSDLGTVDALAEALADANGHVRLDGGPYPLQVDSRNNTVVSGSRKVVLVDVEDLVVVDTNDAVLIMRKGSSQKVKAIVEMLKTTDPQLLE